MTAEHLVEHERAVTILGGDLPSLADQMREPGTLQATIPVSRLDRAGDKDFPTEEEVGEDYFAFLDDVESCAADDNSEQGQHMRQLAELYRHNTAYLSVERRHEAIRGLGRYYEERLRADPAARVVFVLDDSFENKSPMLITRELIAAINNSGEDGISDRVSMARINGFGGDIRSWQPNDAQHTSYVFADDQMLRGAQMTGQISTFYEILDQKGLSVLKDRAEVCLLIARKDQIDGQFAIFRPAEGSYNVPPCPVVAYYTAQESDAIDSRQPVPTSSHSTSDWGFRDHIVAMDDYLKSRGIERSLPFIILLPKSYASFHIMQSSMLNER